MFEISKVMFVYDRQKRFQLFSH